MKDRESPLRGSGLPDLKSVSGPEVTGARQIPGPGAWLFAPEEIDAQNEQIRNIEARRKNFPGGIEAYWAELKAIEKSHVSEMVRRVQLRPDEYLSSLLVLVGSRGTSYLTFDTAFAHSTEDGVREIVRQFDTPEVRRDLYTILRALGEIPSTWATSAFVRFLRNVGEQRKEKYAYHGKGAFAKEYGWTEREVENFCRMLTCSDSACSMVLNHHADVQSELEETDTEMEIISPEARFAATRIERDKGFINQLCNILEARGLADPPRPAAESPSRERRPKTFKSGDLLSKSNLRDLPMPARIRIPVDKRLDSQDQWLKDTIDVVLTHWEKGAGHWAALPIGPDGKAYRRCGWGYSSLPTRWLVGATFLSAFEGKVEERNELKLNFRIRRRDMGK